MADNSILKTFAKFVSFNILSMIGLSCYILADTYFVANGVGETGLAALNIAIPVFSGIIAIGAMFGIGTGTCYSIMKARRKDYEANSIFTNSVIFGIIISTISVIGGIFIPDKVSKIMGADSETLELTSEYTQIIMIFAPLFIINNILVSMLRNDGAPKASAFIMITGSLSNVVLDYIFIYPLGYGMRGAAAATVASPLISIILSVIFIMSGKISFHFVKCRLEFNILKKIVSFGISAFITEMASAITILIFNKLILIYSGNTGIAAYGIIANLALVVTAIFNGISQGIQPLASSGYGLKDSKRLSKILKYSIILTTAIFLIIYPLSYILTDKLVDAFNNEKNAELAKLASDGLRLYFTGFIFAGINIVSVSFLNSINHTKKAFTISIMRGFAVIVPTAFILSKIAQMNGIWLTFPTAELITFIFSVIFLMKKDLYKFD